jgi:amphi-Trp domain-containing protein
MPREVTGRGDIVAKPLAVRQSRTVSAKAVARVPPAVVQPAPVVRPAERERVIAAIPAKFHGRARRDAAAFYLTQLARGVLAGELAIAVGEHQIQLATAEFVVLKIEAKQRKRANHVSVKLRWPRRPLIRVAAAGGSRDGR